MSINYIVPLQVFSFMDMHTGGYTKTSYSHLYIEAFSEEEAVDIFINTFGVNPKGSACSCCGDDFSIYSHSDIKQATGYERQCEFEEDKYIEKPKKGYERVVSIEDFLSRGDITYIKHFTMR